MPWTWTTTSHHGRTTRHQADHVLDMKAQREQQLADPGIRELSAPWRESDAEVLTHCPHCGSAFAHQYRDVQHHTCRCGVIHVRRKCSDGSCGLESFTPAHDDGCGPIPFDAEAAADKYRTGNRKWRPA